MNQERKTYAKMKAFFLSSKKIGWIEIVEV